MDRSIFSEEPITATRAPSARLLRESRTPTSVRPTLRVDPMPAEDPDVWVEEIVELPVLDPPPAAIFAVEEVYATRPDPRAE